MIDNFLSARWENLIMANYAVNPEVLKPFLPNGGKSGDTDHLSPVEADHLNPEQTDHLNPVQIDHPLSCI